ncbi:protein of unknown function [Candidatus Nitrosotalea okcheonensis]|uniref:Uncharacterized protein n=1 Tax=Candidatus Nitrosotalea okcheonensis TaxID=1903276 RepID=A0A2H1FF36_9ARCH|nr:protein of unknown function [Candidatus Nitrosotalea okcheonensis]
MILAGHAGQIKFHARDVLCVGNPSYFFARLALMWIQRHTCIFEKI